MEKQGWLIGGRYLIEQIEEPLGEGATGAVYRASDQRQGGALVTLKLYQHFLGGDATNDLNAAAAQMEAAILRQLDHPHIMRVLDTGIDHERSASYLIFPYIAGQTLAQRRAAVGQLALDEVADVGNQLADAIDYLHSQGVIHRDIKPANVLRDANGQLYLFDFGSASVAGMRTPPVEAARLVEVLELREVAITAANAVAGTPEYLAPEQMRGGAVGPAADIYALGMTLYELATGLLPFMGASMWQVLAQVAQQDAPPASQFRADLPSAASDALARALDKIPARRYPTAQALAHAFADGIHGVVSSLDAPSVMELEPSIESQRPDRLLLDIFISYSRRDAALIARLDRDLQQNGFRTWVDKSELVGGREWRRDLLASIERAQIALVALSPDSVRSQYCAMEYTHALERKRGVLPILIAPCEIPRALAHIQVIDFTQDYATGLRDLLRALRVYAQVWASQGKAPHPRKPRGWAWLTDLLRR